ANRQGLCPDKEGARAGGILYRDGICKLSLFSRACDDDGLVLIWLQDVAGFDVGTAAEAEGLLGFGSNLIYANSTHRSPVLTVLLRKASGAGYYAMAGLPFKPVVQLATVCTRLGVMEGRTLALGTYRSKLGSNLELKESPEKEKLQQGMQALAEAIEADMEPLRAASAQQVDELVDLAGLRDYLVALVEACYQSSGTRRIKNPRIWTLHELSTLERAQDTQHEPKR
ncbi:MAG: carboxyl transferase domain-containing protein, partial [Myxococcota bacterium]|nr:carboxyl transferase domain-containing protein [Myxococcota bacterium]